MRAWVILTTLMMLLAGCAGSEDDGEPTETTTGTTTGTGTSGTQTTTGTATSTSTNTGTGGPGNGGNESEPRPPTAILELSNVTGTAPLSLNLTINATDPDGDLAAWTVDFGDNSTEDGTEFPTTLSHTWATDGTYNITLTVVDATGLNDTNTVSITVEAGGLGGFVLTADMDLECPGCRDVSTDACLERQTGMGLFNDCIFLPMPAAAAGLPFIFESTGGDPDLRWRAGTECNGSADEYVANDGPESGIVPPGIGCVMMWEYASTPSTLTLTIG